MLSSTTKQGQGLEKNNKQPHCKQRILPSKVKQGRGKGVGTGFRWYGNGAVWDLQKFPGERKWLKLKCVCDEVGMETSSLLHFICVLGVNNKDTHTYTHMDRLTYTNIHMDKHTYLRTYLFIYSLIYLSIDLYTLSFLCHIAEESWHGTVGWPVPFSPDFDPCMKPALFNETTHIHIHLKTCNT